MAVEDRLQFTVCFLIARNSSALSFPTDSPHSTSWLFNGGGTFTRENVLSFLFPRTGFLLCILGDWMAKVLITSESELTSSFSKKKKRKITWIVIITDSIYWTQATWLTVGWALCIHYGIYYSQRQLHTLNAIILSPFHQWENSNSEVK